MAKHLFKKGHACSEETRKKLSEQKKGDNNPSKRPEVKEKMRIAKLGKKLNIEHIEKIRASNKGRKWTEEQKYNVRGDKSRLWKGGKTKENQIYRTRTVYSDWRKEIFKRDSYTCYITGQIGGKLVAHHIENFSSNKDKRYELSNGITLSETMHSRFHIEYGKKHNNALQLEEFKTKVNNERRI